ncbi:uncharacterized protein LOC134801043 [Cydia splendana]|uniref:uncharacterized protein LOC134801043 n=1 Tax=Cydia splendana TaxID=1100963 RepID=UPI0028F4C727
MYNKNFIFYLLRFNFKSIWKMSPPILLFLVLVATCELFHQATCPPVSGPECGLSGYRKSDNEQLIKNKAFRRKSIDPDRPWHILNPEELWHLKPTTTPPRIYWNKTNERCDYIRFRCMKAHRTGAICARTIDYQYHSFVDYCALEFHNCVARFDEVWSIAYMGYCTPIFIDETLYVDMTDEKMSNDSKLQQMYVADLGDETEFENYATYPPEEMTEIITRIITDENGEYHIVTETIRPTIDRITYDYDLLTNEGEGTNSTTTIPSDLQRDEGEGTNSTTTIPSDLQRDEGEGTNSTTTI